MHMFAWPPFSARTARRAPSAGPLVGLAVIILGLWTTSAVGMTAEEIGNLRQDTQDLFYHGFDNYMAHGFPEDELRPLSCQPQTRNRRDPADIGLNDVLGNYSLTLIDSLSTLAILASGGEDDSSSRVLKRNSRQWRRNPLRDFQDGVKSLVGLYGDGTEAQPCGTRACGFDLDSKVQVFETNIRGVGGLLSAHLFAVGDLPIRGYDPVWKSQGKDGGGYIQWPNGFRYHGQLLNLAYDLASRLLPAFATPTGIPYPRVNLRHGIPFYRDTEGTCRVDGTSSDVRELTENCAAGAGSLVLEFSTLSRLTGDLQFENLAKQAFWAIWNRRSSINLIGNGIDAENGQWTSPSLAGIGAGVDSFFEYAMKSAVLLSNLPYDPAQAAAHAPESFLGVWQQAHEAVRHHIYRDRLLEKHPMYSQVDQATGAPRYSWVDNLSAYYPGLLVLAGEVDEAIESHLLYAALWTRYSALPERWHAANAWIDPNFRHWAGRPEFIESTFYLYQATRDPYYLHVGEMTLRDIRRRCWTPCGWADLADVETGEKRDRMESFFLGETAKYLYLLFTPEHPLNKLDQAVVFTTEGHPLLIPRKSSRSVPLPAHFRRPRHDDSHINDATCPAAQEPLPLTISRIAARTDLFHAASMAQLHLVPVNPVRPSPLEPPSASSPGIDLSDLQSPSNYSFYPWTLPRTLIPLNGTSAPIRTAVVSTLTFPNLHQPATAAGAGSPGHVAKIFEAGTLLPPLGAVQKLADGVLLTSLSNIKLSMVQEPRAFLASEAAGGGLIELPEYRIQAIANWALGKDERVLVTGEAFRGLGANTNDEHFRRVKDLEKVDLVLDVPVSGLGGGLRGEEVRRMTFYDVDEDDDGESAFGALWNEFDSVFGGLFSGGGFGTTTDSSTDDDEGSQEEGFDDDDGGKESASPAASTEPPRGGAEKEKPANAKASTTPAPTKTPVAVATPPPSPPVLQRRFITALLPVGAGAAPLSSALDAFDLSVASVGGIGHLPLQRVFFLHGTLCGADEILPTRIVKSYSILVIKRGGCSFNEKLAHIPAFVPGSASAANPDAAGLQLVVVLSGAESRAGGENVEEEVFPEHAALVRPLLDQPQRTPNGFERRYPIPLVLVDGGTSASVLRAPGTGNELSAEDFFSNEEAFRRLAVKEGEFDAVGGLFEWEGEKAGSAMKGSKRNGNAQRNQQQQKQPRKGMAVKRRYWFESLGVVIGNMAMV